MMERVDAILEIARWPLLVYLLWFVAAVAYLLIRWLCSAVGLGRRCRLTDPSDAALTDGFAPGEPGGAEVLVTLVHGTWGRNSGWHQPGSWFRTRLAEELGQRGVHKLRFRQFLWSGSNSVRGRERAARLLGQLRARGRTTAPEVFVAHSHGAHVVLRSWLRGNGRGRGTTSAAGLACLGAPFLVGSPRERLRRAALAVGLAPLVAAAVLAWGADDLFSPARRIGAVLLVVLLVAAALKIGLGVLRCLLPATGLPAAVGRRLLVVRASGDEASGVLSVSYMATWLLNKVVALFGAGVPAARGSISDIRRLWRLFRGLFVAFLILVGLAMLVVVRTSDTSSRVGWLEAAAGSVLLSGGLAFLIAVFWIVVQALGKAVSVVVEVLSQVVVGALLLPFGPEYILASPFVLVTSEAIPPVENGDRLASVVQLGLGSGDRSGMQHVVYDHERTPGCVAQWIQRECLPAAGAAPRKTRAARRRRKARARAHPSSRSRASGGGSLQTS